MTKYTTRPSGLMMPRRQVLKGIGATTAAAAMSMPVTKRAFGSEEHPLTGRTIDMNILGIAGWLPSSLSVAMTPLFNDYVKQRFGYEVEFAFAEAPFQISSSVLPHRWRPAAKSSTSLFLTVVDRCLGRARMDLATQRCDRRQPRP